MQSISSPRQLAARMKERIEGPSPVPPAPRIADGARPLLDTIAGDPQSGAMIDAQRAWAAHVDAGRIGVRPPDPTGPGDYRFASLEAILYGARGGRRA